jgi:hypothetical protein
MLQRTQNSHERLSTDANQSDISQSLNISLPIDIMQKSKLSEKVSLLVVEDDLGIQ